MEKNYSDFLSEIYQNYSWNFRKGIGTFLLIEFGLPFLEIREPLKKETIVVSKHLDTLLSRRVTSRGQWQLWVQSSDWKLQYLDKLVSCDDVLESQNLIIKSISGQKLVKVKIDNDANFTEFRFDLGGVIELPFSKINGEVTICWQIFRNDGKILTCDSNGVINTN